MSLRTILGTLMVRPIQLLLEMLCSLFIRMSLNPGIAILCLSLVICLMVSPLKPKHRPDFRKEAFREALQAYASRDRRFGKIK